MEEIDDGSHACRSGKIAVGDKIQLGYEHLLRRKKTNEIGVMIGGQAGIVGHVQIADGARINAQSGVTKSIKSPGGAVTGSPAAEYTSTLRSQAISRKLPELEKRLKELEEQIRQLLAEKV